MLPNAMNPTIGVIMVDKSPERNVDGKAKPWNFEGKLTATLAPLQKNMSHFKRRQLPSAEKTPNYI
jgi:hypothetical protein